MQLLPPEKNMAEMDSTQLLEARKRLHNFLLPNLIGLDAFENEKDPVKVFLGNRSTKNSELSRNSLRLSEEIAPEIDKTISSVCAILQIPRALVDVFVFPSSELNG
jgi:hypothetical protein